MAAITKGLLGSNIMMGLASSIVFGAPLGSVFQSLNQFQLLMLIPLLDAYIPSTVLMFLNSMEISLINIDLHIEDYFPPLKLFIKLMDFPQPTPYLDQIGFSSGSSVINMIFSILFFYVMLFYNIFVIIIYKQVEDPVFENWYTKQVKRLYQTFLYGVYIRMFIEAYLKLIITCMNEIYVYDTSDLIRIISASISLFMLLFTVMILIQIIYFWATLKRVGPKRR